MASKSKEGSQVVAKTLTDAFMGVWRVFGCDPFLFRHSLQEFEAHELRQAIKDGKTLPASEVGYDIALLPEMCHGQVYAEVIGVSEDAITVRDFGAAEVRLPLDYFAPLEVLWLTTKMTKDDN